MESIAIRFLKQFIVLCCLRLVMMNGLYVEMNVLVVMSLLVLSCLLTILFESFDKLIVHLMRFRYVLYILIIMGLIGSVVFDQSMYFKVLLGYSCLVMIKDLWKISTIQMDIRQYQQSQK